MDTLPDREAPETCPNCGSPLGGRYCQSCGQKRTDPRDLTVKHFFKEVLHELTDLDSKLVRTFSALLLRPGLLTAEYLAGRKGRYIKPVRLYLIVSALYFFFAWDASLDISNFEQQLRADPLLQSFPISSHDRWFEKAGQYSAYFRFASVLGFALALAALFRRSRRYFVEHLVFAFHYYSFDFCFFSLLILPLMALRAVTGVAVPPWALSIGIIVLPIYIFVALRRVYGDSTTKAAIKSLALLACDFFLSVAGDFLALVVSYLVVYFDSPG